MKIILLAFITLSTMAIFQKEQFVSDCSKIPFVRKIDCEKDGSSCVEMNNVNCEYAKIELQDFTETDFSSPIYDDVNAESCSDEQDCQDKSALKICDTENEYYVSIVDNQVLCRKVTYSEITLQRNVVVEDAAKKADYDAKKAKESAIKLAQSKIDCGQEVIAYLTVLNAPKGLTTDQIKTMNQTYSGIKNLLETGSLETARIEILNVVADGTLITESDKTNLVSQLDSCK